MDRKTPSPTGASEPFIPEHPHLQALNDAISSKALPCSNGVFAVQPEDLILYYGMKGPNSKGLGRIDFTAPADDEVQHLAESCDVATFGRGLQDVHDESYRKAGKLDRTQFCASFCPELSGLMNVIRHSILEGHSGKGLRIELYKLNVYGPGSFFKAHKDTPRAENNVASLVVVLPTRHEGGALVLRHEGDEFNFDSGELLSDVQAPSVAYAAFFGDIEHAVEPVVSGYRVTITYNLYLVDAATPDAPQSTAYELALKDAFRALLQDTDYLPQGGLIGFGLRHEYPLDTFSIKQDCSRARTIPIDALVDQLKGSDAVLQKVCADLGLRASLRIIYYDEYGTVMCPAVLQYWDGPGQDNYYSSYVREQTGGVTLEAVDNDSDSDCDHNNYDNSDYNDNDDSNYNDNDGGGYNGNDNSDDSDDSDDNDDPCIVVHWATRKRPLDVRKIVTPYVAYGNDAFMALVYGTLCLVVEVGPAELRSTAIA